MLLLQHQQVILHLYLLLRHLTHLVLTKHLLPLPVRVLLPRRQGLHDDATTIDSSNDVLDVVENCKLALWERTLHKTALPIAQLADLVVPPDVEVPTLKDGHAMPSPANQLRNFERLLVLIIHVVQF